jgi:hypothetical protein
VKKRKRQLERGGEEKKRKSYMAYLAWGTGQQMKTIVHQYIWDAQTEHQMLA